MEDDVVSVLSVRSHIHDFGQQDDLEGSPDTSEEEEEVEPPKESSPKARVSPRSDGAEDGRGHSWEPHHSFLTPDLDYLTDRQGLGSTPAFLRDEKHIGFRDDLRRRSVCELEEQKRLLALRIEELQEEDMARKGDYGRTPGTPELPTTTGDDA
ncbi:unnamed protein product [Merluccius merluccius]